MNILCHSIPGNGNGFFFLWVYFGENQNEVEVWFGESNPSLSVWSFEIKGNLDGKE